MKRKLFWASMFFTAGIYAGNQMQPETLLLVALFLLAVLLIKYIFYLSAENRRVTYSVMLLAGGFLLGAFLMQLRSDITLNPYHNFENKSAALRGTILGKPEDGEYQTTYAFRLDSISYQGTVVNARQNVRLSVPHSDSGRFYEYGEILSLTGTLTLPAEAMNAGGFDYAVYLRSKGGTYTCRAFAYSIEAVGQKKFTPVDYARLLSFRFQDVISEQLPGQTGAVMRGMLLSDKSMLSDEMNSAFKSAGLSHVIAVSGMHVGYVLLMLFFMTKLVGLKKRPSGIIAAVFLLFYMAMVGFTSSVVRATVMAFIVIGASIVYRQADPLTSLGIAALVLLGINPYSAFDAGFMLSFSATLGILIFSGHLEEKLNSSLDKTFVSDHSLLKKLISVACVTISAQVFTIPVSIYLFGTISAWSLATNLLVTFIIPPIMAAGFLMCIAGSISYWLAFPFAGFGYLLMLYFNGVVSLFGAIPFGIITVGELTPYFLLTYCLLVITFYMLIRNRRWFFIKTGSAAVLVLIMLALCFPSMLGTKQQGSACFINVGQGDSSLLSLGRNNDILIDAGGKSDVPDRDNTGIRIVTPYLDKKGVSDIEYALVSHYHDDHARGMLGVMSRTKVKRLILPFSYEDSGLKEELIERAAECGTKISFVASGDIIEVSEHASLEFLTPDREWIKGQTNENNHSAVTRVHFGETKILYTGDMEKEGEAFLLDTQTENLPADLIKVGHHGSATSTCDSFLSAVSPEYAVISVGENNNYGHPKQSVLDRLDEHHIQTFRTDLDKDVCFSFDTKGITGVRTGVVK